MKKITLTMTTCKRLLLFMKTIQSFFENCMDLDLIKEIIIIDDGSSDSDIKGMFTILSDCKYNIKFIQKKNKGHARSLNILFDNVKTDYIFHLEDDWEFIKKDNFIRKGFKILDDNKKIKSVIMRNWIEQGCKQNDLQKTKTGIKYYIHNYNGQKFIKGEVNTYPGYSLNPSLQNISDIKKIGKFENKELFELRFAYRYFSYDYKVALTEIDYCKHIGNNINAYRLNNTKE